MVVCVITSLYNILINVQIEKIKNDKDFENYYKPLIQLENYILRLTKIFQKLVEENGTNMYEKLYKLAKERIKEIL